MLKYLETTPFEFFHSPNGWYVTLGVNLKVRKYTLKINGVEFEDMAEAPPRDRAALARSAIIMKMDGPKKTAKFGLLRKGKYTGVTVVLNTHTKFSKLTVGKHVVTAKQRNSGY